MGVYNISSMGLLVRDLSKIGLLSHKEQTALRDRMRDDSISEEERVEAKAELVESILKYAFTRGRYWQERNPHISIEDLVQTAFLGAMQAVDTWRPERAKLTYWCKLYSDEACRKYLAYYGASQTRIPRKVWPAAVPDVVELDAPVGDEENGNRKDEIVDVNAEYLDPLDRVFSEEVSALLLDRLPPQYAEVLRSYYGLGGCDQYNMTEISVRMKISQQRVHQIRRRAVEKLAEMEGIEAFAA